MHRKQIEKFAQIAECKTLAEVYQANGMTEEEVRELIAGLEDEVGYPVISPSFDGIKLTKYGKILRNNAERILADFTQVEEAMKRVAARQNNCIRFGCFATTHSFMVLPQIAHEFPDKDFKAIVCAARDIVSGLGNGRIDVAVIPTSAVPEGCDSFEIVEESAYLSVPYTSALAMNDEITLDDLRSEPLFMVSDLYGLTQWYEEIFEASGGDPARVQRRELKDYSVEMTDTPCSHFSTSITQLFDSSNSGRVEIPINADVAHRSVSLAWPAEKSAELASIIEFVRENKGKLYTSRAFMPYLLQPARIHNLDSARS